MLLNGYICKAFTITSPGGWPSVFIKELLIRALTKSPGVSTSGLSSFISCIHNVFLMGLSCGLDDFVRSGIQGLHSLHTPLTTISTCSAVKPLGSLIAGIATPSRHIVLPHD
jgi:hypothetical protein